MKWVIAMVNEERKEKRDKSQAAASICNRGSQWPFQQCSDIMGMADVVDVDFQTNRKSVYLLTKFYDRLDEVAMCLLGYRYPEIFPAKAKLREF
ncbi:hypothetical protein KQX54_007925 [Cotesia glomerata]|uniref:Uncharacterized protein n=1 Tax=Cotesia glomerata TaxID=32391 RepID=A0AAV7J049_COTGL|nr:hypothetical protein KQX54_007925 [Cotesia glomerata]